MDATSIKETILRYPLIFVLLASFAVVLFSINQIINLAKPNVSSFRQADTGYMLTYPTVTAMAYMPNQDYVKFKSELSAKFPKQPEIAAKFNITADIANLPINEQGSAIRLRLLEARVEYMQSELIRVSDAQSEQLIFRLPFYFWSFLIWMGSIVIGRILEHLTDKFNAKYLRDKA